MAKILKTLNSSLISPILIFILLGVGIFLSAKLKFFHITKAKKVFVGMLDSGNAKKRSPFREVSVALAGTLGVGNLMGVSVAISLGGAGAVFWMWVGALFSMILKYGEIVLAVKFRIENTDGFSGGAMYYIKKPFFKMLFAILCVLTSFSLGNMMQVRAVSECFTYVFSFDALLCGILLAAAVFFIIIFGHRGVSRFTSIIIPISCAIYIFLSLYVIFTNIYALPSVIYEIFSSAFTLPSLSGGIVGFISAIFLPIRYGISRGLITNEAGCGTAPIAHAAAETKCAAQQGFWGIFEVFVDTVLLCTLSAFVILIAKPSFPAGRDMENVLLAFRTYCGSFSDYILSICVLFFAVAGIVGWYYYGLVGLDFFFAKKEKCLPTVKKLYAVTYSFCVALGAVISSEVMWDLSDISIGLMALINTPTVFSYRRLIANETKAFFSKKIT